MSNLNQLIDNLQLRATLRRALAAASALILMAALISLTATARAHAAGPLTITVSNTGMTPTSVTVSGGIVHLKIENSSSRASITLRINRAKGELVREVTLPEGTPELSVELEIGAGQYVVTDTSNKAWACVLTVQ